MTDKSSAPTLSKEKIIEEITAAFDSFFRHINVRFDEMERRLDRIDSGLNRASNRMATDVGRAIGRPRTFHSASEYHDIWGSGRRRLSHYG